MASLKKISLRDVKAEQSALKLVEAGKLLNPLFSGIKDGLLDLERQAARHDDSTTTVGGSVWDGFADAMQTAANNDISPDDFAVLAMANFPKDFAENLKHASVKAYISTAVNGYDAMLSTYAERYATDVTERSEAYTNKVDGARKVAGPELTAAHFITNEAFAVDTGNVDKDGKPVIERITLQALRKVISGVNAEVMKEKGAPALRFQSLLKTYTSAITESVKDRKENAEKHINGLQGRDLDEMCKWLEARIAEVPARHPVHEGTSKPVISKTLEAPQTDAAPARGVRKVG